VLFESPQLFLTIVEFSCFDCHRISLSPFRTLQATFLSLPPEVRVAPPDSTFQVRLEELLTAFALFWCRLVWCFWTRAGRRDSRLRVLSPFNRRCPPSNASQRFKGGHEVQIVQEIKILELWQLPRFPSPPLHPWFLSFRTIDWCVPILSQLFRLSPFSYRVFLFVRRDPPQRLILLCPRAVLSPTPMDKLSYPASLSPLEQTLKNTPILTCWDFFFHRLNRRVCQNIEVNMALHPFPPCPFRGDLSDSSSL